MIDELLMLTISFMGIFFGFLLSYIAPEELKSGRKYFLFSQKILFILILNLAVYFNFGYWILVVIVAAVTIYFVQFTNFKRDHFSKLISKKKISIISRKELFFTIINYCLFAAYFIIETNLIYRLILCSLIFAYGLPTGSLLRKIPRKFQ